MFSPWQHNFPVLLIESELCFHHTVVFFCFFTNTSVTQTHPFTEIFRELTTNKEVKWTEWHDFISLTSFLQTNIEGHWKLGVYLLWLCLCLLAQLSQHYMGLDFVRALVFFLTFLSDYFGMTGCFKRYIWQNTKCTQFQFCFVCFLSGKRRQKVSVSICRPLLQHGNWQPP